MTITQYFPPSDDENSKKDNQGSAPLLIPHPTNKS